VATGSHAPVQSNQGRFYSSTSHSCPENWWSPLHPHPSQTRVTITSVDRLSARLRLEDLEPIPIVDHPHPQVCSTFRHHARGSDSCRQQRAVRIWFLYSHRSYFLPFFRTHRVNHCTAPRFSLVPAELRVTSLTRFMPRHGARIKVTDEILNPNSIHTRTKLPSPASDHFRHSLPRLWLYRI